MSAISLKKNLWKYANKPKKLNFYVKECIKRQKQTERAIVNDRGADFASGISFRNERILGNLTFKKTSTVVQIGD